MERLVSVMDGEMEGTPDFIREKKVAAGRERASRTGASPVGSSGLLLVARTGLGSFATRVCVACDGAAVTRTARVAQATIEAA